MEKNKPSSLDTNVLLRFVLGDVPAQSLLVEELLQKTGTLHVADIALIEMVFVLETVYGFTRADVVTSITTIIRHPKINSNRKLFELALPSYVQYPKLSIVDCALQHYAALNGTTPLFTFDKALAQAYPDTVSLLTQHEA
jgi:uncharacterized protein